MLEQWAPQNNKAGSLLVMDRLMLYLLITPKLRPVEQGFSSFLPVLVACTLPKP